MRLAKTWVILPFLLAFVVAQDQPELIDVTDKPRLEAAKGRMVVIRGKVSSAEWSDSGKVLNIEFENAPHIMAAAFEKNREKLDAAFGGDFAKSILGGIVRFDGTISDYGGFTPKYKNGLQIVVSQPTQVTIVQLGPTTHPTNPDPAPAK